MRMRSIILSSFNCLAVPYFSTISHKRQDIRKKLLKINCVFRHSQERSSEKFLILRRIQLDTIINVHSL
jgi:hypothetical protein